MATPLTVVHLERVGSTQDEAGARFAGDPVLVTAQGQDRGRGRTGSSWLDADRAIAASLAFDPGWEPDRMPIITLVAGLAALDVLPERVGLKWPNDVVVDEGKVGGILVEAGEGRIVAGLGLNVAWLEPPEGAAALYESDPGPEPGRRLAEHWAEALVARAARGPDAWGRDEYLDRCRTLGRRITWEPDGEGEAVDVDESGRLLVRSGETMVALDSGVVRDVRPV